MLDLPRRQSSELAQHIVGGGQLEQPSDVNGSRSTDIRISRVRTRGRHADVDLDIRSRVKYSTRIWSWREEILFVAFAGWDAAGAKLFGYPTYWVNRPRLPPEELSVLPDGSGETSMISLHSCHRSASQVAPLLTPLEPSEYFRTERTYTSSDAAAPWEWTRAFVNTTQTLKGKAVCSG